MCFWGVCRHYWGVHPLFSTKMTWHHCYFTPLCLPLCFQGAHCTLLVLYILLLELLIFAPLCLTLCLCFITTVMHWLSAANSSIKQWDHAGNCILSVMDVCIHKHEGCFHIVIMAYGSTPYVRMTPTKIAATLKVTNDTLEMSALDRSTASISHIRHYQVIPLATGPLTLLESHR